MQTTTAPTFYPRNVVSRTTQLACAHGIARKLGLETRKGHDRTEYEAFLFGVIGRRSLKSASREQRNAVVKALELELACREFAEAVVRAPALDPSEYSDDVCLSLLEVA